jgi:hypothetical protein
LPIASTTPAPSLPTPLGSGSAVIGVDEVQADRRVPDPGLAFPGIADFDVVELQNLGPACLVESDCLSHGSLLGIFSILACCPAGTLSRSGVTSIGSKPMEPVPPSTLTASSCGI